VTLDLAGHGESAAGRDAWTIEAFAGDVVAVVEALDLARVVLVGHSMGGPVALEAARRLPGRIIGIVGVDTYQNFEASFTEEQRQHFISRFETDFKAVTNAFVRNMFTERADSALVDYIAADMSSASPGVGIGAMGSILGYRPQETLGELEVPIYSINSDRFPTNVEANKRSAHEYHCWARSSVR
jgi:pimeloyl-ACP methyl ester carboxylesterase